MIRSIFNQKDIKKEFSCSSCSKKIFEIPNECSHCHLTHCKKCFQIPRNRCTKCNDLVKQCGICKTPVMPSQSLKCRECKKSICEVCKMNHPPHPSSIITITKWRMIPYYCIECSPNYEFQCLGCDNNKVYEEEIDKCICGKNICSKCAFDRRNIVVQNTGYESLVNLFSKEKKDCCKEVLLTLYCSTKCFLDIITQHLETHQIYNNI